ncbi:hypothetical protein [Nocardia sp. BMG111209]|uniref:hypothetical protein n=1 Tax=Nocardia sp. BMG111209 TaxID=1160137 RepID=UPI0012DDB028|nr:hypothetical protein [Nocardia sp. BMG111209]
MAWWQIVLGWGGGIISAVIAASVAVRSARKTPYEALRALVELHDSEHLSDEQRAVLDKAIEWEIGRLAGITNARWRGFWAYVRERVRQLLPAAAPGQRDLFGEQIDQAFQRRPRQPPPSP